MIYPKGYKVNKETISLDELRQTELYRKEQTRFLRELLDEKSNTLSDADMECFVKNWFNLHPETKLTEHIAAPLYSILHLCKAIKKLTSV